MRMPPGLVRKEVCKHAHASAIAKKARWGAGGGGVVSFRDFVNEQAFPAVLRASLLHNLVIIAAFVKCTWGSGTFHGDLGCVLPFLAIYIVLPFVFAVQPAYMEACLVAAMGVRVALSFAIHAGFVPVLSFARFMTSFHFEKFNEVAIMGIMEPVRLSWMVPMRMLLAYSYWGMYKAVGVQTPTLSVLVHATALLVGVVANLHYRRLYRLYTQRMQLQQQEDVAGVVAAKRGQLPGPAEHEPTQAPAAAAAPRLAPGLSHYVQPPSLTKCPSTQRQRAVQQGGYDEEQVSCYQARVRKARRCALKLHGNITPEMVEAKLDRLQAIIQGRLLGASVQSMAIRSGCVVICFDVYNVDESNHSQGETMRSRLAEAVREWGAESELEMIGWEPPALVQMCHNRGCSSQEQLSNPPLCSLNLPNPILLMPPSNGCPAWQPAQQPTHHTHPAQPEQAQQLEQPWQPRQAPQLEQAQQLGQAPQLEQAQQLRPAQQLEQVEQPGQAQDRGREPCAEAPLEVALQCEVLHAPPHMHAVRGWRGPADSPEDLENMGRQLCLLAGVQGRYYPVRVLQQTQSTEGVHVQACLEMPLGAHGRVGPCSIVFELWAGGCLEDSAVAALLPSACAPAVAELDAWDQAAPGRADFVHDLVDYLHFLSTGSPAHPDAQSMDLVARGLVEYALACGMVELAGLLGQYLALAPGSPPSVTLTAQTLTQHNSDADADADELTQAADARHAGTGKSLAAEGLLGAHAACPILEPASAGAGGAVPAAAAAPAAPAAAQGQASCMVLPGWWRWWQAWACHISKRCCAVARVGCLVARGQVQPHGRAHDAPLDSEGKCGSPAALPCSMGRGLDADSSSGGSGGVRSNGRGVSWGGDGAAGSGDEEQQYRVWVNARCAMPTKSFLIFLVVNPCVLFLRSVLYEDQVLTDVPGLALLLGMYVAALLGALLHPCKNEVMAVTLYLQRMVVLWIIGQGLVPLPSSFKAVFRCRADILLESLSTICIEPVRMQWLIPLRALVAVSYCAFYQHCGCTRPWLQALAINTGCLLVGFVVDKQHRRAFARQKAGSTSAPRAATLKPSLATTS